MTALRRARLASAAMSARSTAAVDSRSSHSAIGSSVRVARLRAKARVDCARAPSDAVHVDRQSEHEADGASFGRQFEDALGVGAEPLAGDGFDRRRHAPVRIAGGDADGLGTEIEPDQRAALRHQRSGFDQREDGHADRLARVGGKRDLSHNPEADYAWATADKFVAAMKGHATRVLVPEKGKAVQIYRSACSDLRPFRSEANFSCGSECQFLQRRWCRSCRSTCRPPR